jgi:hypothetical protein
MLSHPKTDGIEISEDRAIDYVPDSLYMFLNLLLGGQQLLEDNVNSEDPSPWQIIGCGGTLLGRVVFWILCMLDHGEL